MIQNQVETILRRDFDDVIRDPVWGSIPLSSGLADLASSRVLASLDGILQLGPAHRVYPGATHTRRAHSIGVCHTGRRILLALLQQGAVPFVTVSGAFSFLAAALCHDVGHFPYAHSLKELPLARHEALAAQRILEPDMSPWLERAGADPGITAAIIDEALPDGGNREIRFFRGLLSGVLDPDKLDYLTRDAFFCGVPYGIQDPDFILRRLAVDSCDRIGVDERGIMSIEGILFSKYLMYRSVYWHRDVRAVTAMVKKDVVAALARGLLLPEQLYGLDDASFFKVMTGLAGTFPGQIPGLASEARAGTIFKPLVDLPFVSHVSAAQNLLDLDKRSEAEAMLADAAIAAGIPARYLGAVPGDRIVIDIPEPVSFETAMPVICRETLASVPFTASPTVFSPEVVRGFTSTLRRLRVFCPVELLAESRSDEAGRAVLEALGMGNIKKETESGLNKACV